ncbi:MAG: hypothetical protein ACFFCZ_28110 [Promethearchaeota archaeon]
MDDIFILGFVAFLSLPLAGFLCKFLDEIVDEKYPIPNYITIPVIFFIGGFCGIAGIIDDVIAGIFLAYIIGLTLANKVDNWRHGLSAVLIVGIIILGRLFFGKMVITPFIFILGSLITLGIFLDEIVHNYIEQSPYNRFQVLKIRPILKIEALILTVVFPQFTLFYALAMWLFDLVYELTRIQIHRHLRQISEAPIPF